MSGMIDYRREAQPEAVADADSAATAKQVSVFVFFVEPGGAPLTPRLIRKRKGSRRSAKEGKAYNEYNEADLKAAAQENHDQPLGSFMGDGREKGHEVEEGGVSHRPEGPETCADLHECSTWAPLAPSTRSPTRPGGCPANPVATRTRTRTRGTWACRRSRPGDTGTRELPYSSPSARS